MTGTENLLIKAYSGGEVQRAFGEEERERLLKRDVARLWLGGAECLLERYRKPFKERYREPLVGRYREHWVKRYR